MMKIALCLFGQPRGLPISLNFLEEGIIKPNDIKDIFYHFWFNPTEAGKPYNSAQISQFGGKVGLVKEDSDKILLEALKPKKYVVESQRNFSHFNYLQNDPSAIPEFLASAFYSRMMAYELCEKYQKENNFQYDVIFCCRLDIFYGHPILVENYMQQINENKLVVMKKFQDDQERKNSPDKPMTDMPCIGNNQTMKIYCEVYNKFEETIKKCFTRYGENIIGRCARLENGLELHKANWDMEILHRVIDLSTI